MSGPGSERIFQSQRRALKKASLYLKLSFQHGKSGRVDGL
jgi:hypothetical protein